TRSFAILRQRLERRMKRALAPARSFVRYQMKIGRTTFVLAALASATALVAACAPSTPPTPAASPPSAQGAAARPLSQVHGDLRQVMRGILSPNSNVVFLAQGTDPATVPKDADGTTSVNPLASVYGGWE